MAARIARLFFAIAILLSANAAHASAQRTFVASYGQATNTASNCSIANPCRAFSDAIGVTSSGGEVIVLDSAGYGTFTITQPVSIIAPRGVYAGISVIAGAGITVNTGGAADVVVLRGLTLNGLGGNIGIQVTKVGALHVSNLEIADFSTRGIFFAANGELYVSDSVARENGETGIHVQPATGSAIVSITHSRFEHNGYNGVAFAGSTVGSISDSDATNHQGVGFLIDQGSNGTISDCRTSNAGYGVMVRGNTARARIARCSSGGSYIGFIATDSAQVAVVDSVATGSYGGFVVENFAVMTVERCAANAGSSGMVVSGGGVLRVSNSTAVENAYGLTVAGGLGGGTVETRQNNTVRGNGIDVSFNVVPFGPQ